MKIIEQGALLLALAASLATGGAEAREQPRSGLRPSPEAALGDRRPAFMSRGGAATDNYLSDPGIIHWNTPYPNGSLASGSTGGGGGGGR